MIIFNFKQLLELVKRRNVYARKEIITALRDWKVLLISGIVVAIFVMIGSAYLFFQINNEQIFQNGLRSPSSIITIDRQRMEKGIMYFEEKSQRFDNLSRQATKVEDPSIVQIR